MLSFEPSFLGDSQGLGRYSTSDKRTRILYFLRAPGSGSLKKRSNVGLLGRFLGRFLCRFCRSDDVRLTLSRGNLAPVLHAIITD